LLTPFKRRTDEDNELDERKHMMILLDVPLIVSQDLGEKIWTQCQPQEKRSRKS